MSAPVSWNLRLALREGQLDSFRALMEAMDGFGARYLGSFGGFAR